MIGSGIVAARSRAQIEEIATSWRRILGHRDGEAVAMLRVLELGLTRIFPDFDYEVVPDAEMQGVEATTSLDRRYMRISQSTYDQAQSIGGRANFTLAHELGHFALHYGQPVAMARGATLKPYLDPEWQANEFASAFLIPAAEAAQLSNPHLLAIKFRTTPAAAQVRLKKLGLLGPAAGGAMK